MSSAGGDKARLPDDCFALPPGVNWTPVEEALDRLRATLAPVTESETVHIMEAAGRILAEPVIAKRSNPPAANAAVDGYAFAWASLPGQAVGLKLMDGRAAAGHPFSGSFEPGQALRILTGAEIPAGADTVVLQEDCEIKDGHVRFPAPGKAGANVRPMGEDTAIGEIVLDPGRRLTQADLARLASIGQDRLRVRKPLRLGVLSTGDEVINPGDDGPGIFDANRPMLTAMGQAFGCEVIDLGIAADDPDTVRARLDAAAETTDALITTGGASTGDEDHIARLLTAEGAISTWRIAVKPGRPLALGMWRGVPVFGLPGNPVAAFVCALIFVRPALSVLAGSMWNKPQGFVVPAAFEKKKKPGRREFLRARIRDARVEIFASEGSGRIGGISWAEGLVDLPDEGAHIRPGDPVTYLPFSSFGL